MWFILIIQCFCLIFVLSCYLLILYIYPVTSHICAWHLSDWNVLTDEVFSNQNGGALEYLLYDVY